MNKVYIKYIKLLPIYVLLQVLVLNEVLFFSYINPYLYILLIIAWPLKGSKLILLFYAFILGLGIDIFSGSLGIHSTATLFVAFTKFSIAKITIPHNVIGDFDEISFKKIGSKAYITYSSLIVLVHNCSLFFLEHFNFNLKIFIKIISSVIVTELLILILNLLASKK